jgi:hypothetical protein
VQGSHADQRDGAPAAVRGAGGWLRWRVPVDVAVDRAGEERLRSMSGAQV